MIKLGLDLGAVAAALATRLGEVAGIRQSYDHVPDAIAVVPAAIVGFGPVSYATRHQVGVGEASFEVGLVVNRPNEAQSQRLLRRLLSFAPEDEPTEGHPSIAAAIAADRTLDGTCGTSHIDPDTPAGGIEVIRFGTTDYLATSLTIRTYA